MFLQNVNICNAYRIIAVFIIRICLSNYNCLWLYLQMATNSSQPYNLEQALKRGGSTCQPLRVRVLHERLATSDAVKRVFIIGDSSSAGECVVYDKLASGRFHVGSSVVILNASVKVARKNHVEVSARSRVK